MIYVLSNRYNTCLYEPEVGSLCVDIYDIMKKQYENVLQFCKDNEVSICETFIDEYEAHIETNNGDYE